MDTNVLIAAMKGQAAVRRRLESLPLTRSCQPKAMRNEKEHGVLGALTETTPDAKQCLADKEAVDAALASCRASSASGKSE